MPVEIPKDCDVVVINANGSKLLKKKKVADFMKKVLQSCPCQDEMGSCPFLDEISVNVGILFDAHAKTIKNWPLKLKYICDESHVGYRHYHYQEIERACCRLVNANHVPTNELETNENWFRWTLNFEINHSTCCCTLN